MITLRSFLIAASALCALATTAQPAPAQPAPASATPSAPTSKAKGETEFLVAPGGGAFEIPIHAGAVCILSFPEKMAGSALTSSDDFEIKSWGADGVAVRANSKARTATLALATVSGSIKVNVTFTVVAEKDDALTLVRFKAVSSEEAFQARLTAELARRTAPLQAELAAIKQRIEDQLRDRADGLIADRLLKRNQFTTLNAHERNSDHVIVHVQRALLLGEDGYLFFEIQNRSGAPFRFARATVTAEGRHVHGPARLFSTAVDKDPTLIGVVAAGSTARGVVMVRNADAVLSKPLVLELADPDGRGTIRLGRGIALR
jgi:Protein of unknown function (DUF2381)